MLIRSHDNGFQHPQGSEITPRASYLQRRAWLQYLAAGSAGAALPGWAAGVQRPGKLAALASVPSQVPGANSMERVTAYADASQYNNFYEFGLDKDDPAKNAHTLKTRPWTVKIEGLVQQPQTLDLDALLKLAPLEERIYRLRCVEGWSMVIPGSAIPGRTAAQGAAAGQREIRGICHPGRQGADAGPAQRRARLAVHGRASPG